MAALSPDVATARNRHNVLIRHRGPNDPAVEEAARDLRAAHLRERVRELVASWPSLTEGQRHDLRALLAPVLTLPG